MGWKIWWEKTFHKKVIETYQALTNREGLNKFINNRIDYSKEYDELEETFDIGEGCTYPDEESFYFCGRSSLKDFSYCKLHLLYAYQPKGKKDDSSEKEEIPEFIEKKIKSA